MTSAKLFYSVPLIAQGVQECAQASITSLLQFHQFNKSLPQVIKEVPVYQTPDGKKLGSSLGHVGMYFQKLGFKTTIHTADIQIFDRSWSKLSRPQLIEALKQRQKHITHPIYDQLAFKAIFSGYTNFLRSGGSIKFPIFSEKYLTDLLKKSGPFLAVVSYNFLYQTSKLSYDVTTNQHKKDPISGIAATHSIIVNGFYRGTFYITDPDQKYGGKKRVKSDLLLGALYLAETDYDCLLITIKK